jgi:hypothetical protein
MAAIVATANGGQTLTLAQDDGVGRERNGGEREIVGLPNHPLGEEIDEGRGAQCENCQSSNPEA